jgi:uncharacterized protein (TIGR02246 family)
VNIAAATAVRTIAAEWEAAWNAHDMSRLAALFTDDADLVTVAATHLKGRAEIERTHAAMHKTQFQASVWKNQKAELQSINRDVTLVHLAWSVHGDFDPDGTPREPRSGLFTWMLVQQHGVWRIRAAQNTNALGAR